MLIKMKLPKFMCVEAEAAGLSPLPPHLIYATKMFLILFSVLILETTEAEEKGIHFLCVPGI